MKKTDIIKETVEYYQTHDRAIVGRGRCSYFDPETGNQCAVGRCLKGVTQYKGSFMSVGKLCGGEIEYLDKMLKKKYAGHSLEFWESLQFLHDYNLFWEGRELSEHGKARVEELMERYKD